MKLLQLQEQQLICPHLTCLSFLSDYWSFAWAHWFQPVCLAWCVSNDLNIILLLFSSVKTLLDSIIKTGRGYPRSFAISAQCCCGSPHTTTFLRRLSPINSFGSTLDVSCVAWGHQTEGAINSTKGELWCLFPGMFAGFFFPFNVHPVLIKQIWTLTLRQESADSFKI